MTDALQFPNVKSTAIVGGTLTLTHNCGQPPRLGLATLTTGAMELDARDGGVAGDFLTRDRWCAVEESFLARFMTNSDKVSLRGDDRKTSLEDTVTVTTKILGDINLQPVRQTALFPQPGLAWGEIEGEIKFVIKRAIGPEGARIGQKCTFPGRCVYVDPAGFE